MMKKKIIILVLLFAGLTIHAQTTYYIDPSGSDATGNGTSSNPWKSLYKACNSVSTSGSIIHVNAGTYTETSKCNLAVGVSIEGAGVTSIIKSTVSGAYNSNAHTLQLYSSSLTNGNQHISNIKMDGGVNGTPSGYGAMRIQKRSNVEISNCTFVDFTDWGVCFRGLYNGENEPTVWAKGNKFHDNSVINCSGYYWQSSYGPDYRNGNGLGCLEITEQEGMRVYNNILTQVGRPTWHNGYCIKGVMGYNRDLKIYNNTLNKEPYNGLTWDFAIELWLCRGGIEIYNNSINGGSIDISGSSSESGVSTQKGSYPYAVSIHDNTIGPSTLGNYLGTHGVLIEQSATDVRIYRNHIKNVALGIYCPLLAKSDGTGKSFNTVNIYYNILENIGFLPGDGNNWPGYGIYMPMFPVLTTGWKCNNVNIWNNVIVAHNGGVRSDHGIVLPVMGATTNISVRNNIVQGFNSYAVYGKGDSGVTLDYLSVENNIFYGNGSNSVGYSGLTPTHNTTQNNLTSNPLFVSSTDFHLQLTSPGHTNPGIDVGLTLDYDSVTVVNPPDRGAFEFTGNHPPSIQNQDFQLNENIPSGTNVGTVVASDPDAGQTLTYTIVSGNTNGAFAINDSTGVLSVANAAALNVDFALVVKVQDNGAGELSSQATITINILFTGIELTGNKGTIKVYPNPVFDELIIETKGNNDRISFNILNSISQIVFKGNLIEKAVVQTTNFSPGVYLIKIENLGSFEFKKIVKV